MDDDNYDDSGGDDGGFLSSHGWRVFLEVNLLAFVQFLSYQSPRSPAALLSGRYIFSASYLFRLFVCCIFYTFSVFSIVPF